MSKNVDKLDFQSPKKITSNWINKKIINLKTGKPYRIITPTHIEEDEDSDDVVSIGDFTEDETELSDVDCFRDDVTEIIDEEDEVQLKPLDLSRQKTWRLPNGDLLPDLIGDKYIGYQRSNWDEYIDAKYSTTMNSIDDESEDGMVPNERTMERKRNAEMAELVQPEANKKGQGSRVLRYCFTYNNPECTGLEFKVFLENTNYFKMGVFQFEMGENGTPHFQGYVELNKSAYTTGVQNAVKPHKLTWLHSKQDKYVNHKYCTKDDTRIEGNESGPWYLYNDESVFKRKNGNQGKRTDLDRFADMVLENGGITEAVVAEMPGHAMQFHKNADNLVQKLRVQKNKEAEKEYWKAEAERKRNGEQTLGQQQRHIELWFGPTGVGKTTTIKTEVIGERELDLYTKNSGNKWWDGYTNEPVVLFDEFNGDSPHITGFNDMTNIGVLPLENKGGTVVLSATEMHFASNSHPSHWWKKPHSEGFYNGKDATYWAVARRFKKVHWWNEDKELTVLDNPGKNDGTAEWKEKNRKWYLFWAWEQRTLEEGDEIVVGAIRGYFNQP